MMLHLSNSFSSAGVEVLSIVATPLYYGAECSAVLQNIAVCCSVLQIVIVCSTGG